jgi:hypothetical protein
VPLEVARQPYPGTSGPHRPHLIVVRGVLGLSKGRCFAQGRHVGRLARIGDDLPLPTDWPHPDAYRHGVEVALNERALIVSGLARVLAPR